MSQNAKSKTGVCDRSRTQCKIDISALSPSAIGALLLCTVKARGDVSGILSDIANTKDLRVSKATESLKAVAAAAKYNALTADFDPSSFADQSQLCERREYLIDAMYDDHAFQCSQTGRRFAMKWELDAHLDEMQARRRRKKTIRDVRNWFDDAATWTSGGVAQSCFEVAPVLTPAVLTASSVYADESQSHCSVSGERFETFWNDEEQEWHYKAAIMLDRPFGSAPAGSLVLASAVSTFS
jgi:pre-mRNA cleavage complex 2 protein Pcf11